MDTDALGELLLSESLLFTQFGDASWEAASNGVLRHVNSVSSQNPLLTSRNSM
jgi:hypothetical protein